jgi:hypothetical protein
MGAWGCGVFENDEALDFVNELTSTPKLDVVRKVLDQANQGGSHVLDVDIASRVLVAVEVVAAISGHPGEQPEELADWLRESKTKKITPEFRIEAQSAAIKVLNKSELRELWNQSPDFEAWRSSVRDLVERLALPPKKLPRGSVTAKRPASRMSNCLCCFGAELIPLRELLELKYLEDGLERSNYAHRNCWKRLNILSLKDG